MKKLIILSVLVCVIVVVGILLKPYIRQTQESSTQHVVSLSNGGDIEYAKNRQEIPIFTLDCSDDYQSIPNESPELDPSREYIRVHTDTVPNFARKFTVKSVRSGQWSNPETWQNKKLPSDGDIVVIDKEHDVEYDIYSDVPLRTVGIAGKLRFSDSVSTKMQVTHLMVYRTGALNIGSKLKPLDESIRAEIIINDQAIVTQKDATKDGYTLDPQQYGNGVLVWGSINLYGAEKGNSFVRLKAPVSVGDKQIELDNIPVEWQSGDLLLFPDSRQIKPNDIGFVDHYPYNLEGSQGVVKAKQWETLPLLDKQQGSLILLKQADFSHNGISIDQNTSLLPHVANISRNIIIRSERANGTRGHTIAFNEARVNFHNVLFKDLGRTTVDKVDNTVITTNGDVQYIGKNQIARYPIHMHHVTNLINLSANQINFSIQGNVVDGGKRWGMSIHSSHFGLIKDNVVFDVNGAGIATEDGSETGNIFEGNFIAAIHGSGLDMEARERGEGVGHEGSGFWFGSDNNIVRNNVVAGVRASGYALFRTERSKLFPVVVDLSDNRFFEFSNNEVYGAAGHGVRIWSTKECKVCKSREASLLDTLIWKSQKGVKFDYHSDYYSLKGLSVYGEDENQIGTIGIQAHHSKLARVNSMTLSGMNIGIEAGGVRNRQFSINNAEISAKTGIKIFTSTSWGGKRSFKIDNVKFTTNTGDKSKKMVEFDKEDYGVRRPKIMQSRPVYLYNHQQITGNNYQLFQYEQSKNYILPQHTDPALGCPEKGMTNAQCYAKHGMAIGSQIASCEDQSISGILAYACPLNN